MILAIAIIAAIAVFIYVFFIDPNSYPTARIFTDKEQFNGEDYWLVAIQFRPNAHAASYCKFSFPRSVEIYGAGMSGRFILGRRLDNPVRDLIFIDTANNCVECPKLFFYIKPKKNIRRFKVKIKATYLFTPNITLYATI